MLQQNLWNYPDLVLYTLKMTEKSSELRNPEPRLLEALAGCLPQERTLHLAKLDFRQQGVSVALEPNPQNYPLLIVQANSAE